jgi:hypothetical protein
MNVMYGIGTAATVLVGGLVLTASAFGAADTLYVGRGFRPERKSVPIAGISLGASATLLSGLGLAVTLQPDIEEPGFRGVFVTYAVLSVLSLVMGIWAVTLDPSTEEGESDDVVGMRWNFAPTVIPTPEGDIASGVEMSARF